MKCMISGAEFDDSKEFPNPSGKDTSAEMAQRAHAAEASRWQHLQLLVDGKEVLAGHLAPNINPASLVLSKGSK